jgi:hypothetical protein
MPGRAEGLKMETMTAIEAFFSLPARERESLVMEASRNILAGCKSSSFSGSEEEIEYVISKLGELGAAVEESDFASGERWAIENEGRSVASVVLGVAQSRFDAEYKRLAEIAAWVS